MATPEFILDLRAKIGTDELWLIGATAVVLRDRDVLLIQRADNGQWSPVTGIVDPGEHPAAAAVREVAEEAGVRVAVDYLAWVNVTDTVVYPNGDRSRYLDHTFSCTWLSGEPFPADDETTAARWWDLADLPPLGVAVASRIAAVVDSRARGDRVTALTPPLGSG
ncbi:MAG: NUDIX domain-containing protein [Austwickia sp.]|nr:NUDIX domain-containing protein [Austwickia sp.]MBK8437248.1 NUDIX domain-containing protein [Austwickia sp.]